MAISGFTEAAFMKLLYVMRCFVSCGSRATGTIKLIVCWPNTGYGPSND